MGHQLCGYLYISLVNADRYYCDILEISRTLIPLKS